jgi:hypothetical protein
LTESDHISCLYFHRPMMPDWKKHPCKTGMHSLLESAQLDNSGHGFAQVLNFKHNNKLRHGLSILFPTVNRPLIGKSIAISQCSLAHDRTLSAWLISLEIILSISSSTSAVQYVCQLDLDAVSSIKHASKRKISGA